MNESEYFAYRQVALDSEFEIWGKQETPGFVVQTNRDSFLLGWHNSVIRHFADEHFDHIEFQYQGVREVKEGWEVQVLQKEVGAIALDDVGDDLAGRMLEIGWPQRFDPVVDAATFHWHARLGALALDSFLKDQQ